MEITTEALGERLQQLIEERAQLVQQHEQVLANINAFNGAIKDCEYWVERLLQEPEAPDGEAQPVDELSKE